MPGPQEAQHQLNSIAKSRGRTPQAPWLRFYPLLPAFQWAATLKAGICMALTSAIMLHPAVTQFLRPSLLTPIAAVASVEATLGAAVVGVARYILGAVLACAYAIVVISVFPPTVPVAAVATAVLTFACNYLGLQVKTKRFLQSSVVVVLWQYADVEGLASRGVVINPSYALQTAAGVAAGCLVGFCVSILPLPGFVTSHREIASRLRLIQCQLSAVVAGATLVFVQDERGKRALRQRFETRDAPFAAIDGSPLPLEATAAVSNGHGDSSSGSALNPLPPPPLLLSDIDDICDEADENIKAIAKVLPDLDTEPAALFTASAPKWLQRAVFKAAAAMLGAGPAQRALGEAAPDALHWKLPSRPQRLKSWVLAHRRLVRLARALVTAERAISPSPSSTEIAGLFARHLRTPLCQLACDVINLYALAIDWSTRLRLCVSGDDVLERQQQLSDHSFLLVGYPGAAAMNGINHTPVVSVADIWDARRRVDDSLVAFFKGYQRTRAAAFQYRLGIVRKELSSGPQQPTHLRLWQKADVLPLHTYLLKTLRFTQILLASVEATCPPLPKLPAGVPSSVPRPLGPPQSLAATQSGMKPRAASVSAVAATVVAFPPTSQQPPAAPAKASSQGDSSPAAHSKALAGLWSSAKKRIGLKWSVSQFKRGCRGCAAITFAALIAVALQGRIGGAFSFWSPTTIAVMAGRGFQMPFYSTLAARVVATLIGCVYALFAARFSQGNPFLITTFAILVTAACQDPFMRGEQWPRIAAFTATTILFVASGSKDLASSLLEERILWSIVGIVTYFVTMQLVFPVSARSLAHDCLTSAVSEIVESQKTTLAAFTTFVKAEAKEARDHMQRMDDMRFKGSSTQQAAAGGRAAPSPAFVPASPADHPTSDAPVIDTDKPYLWRLVESDPTSKLDAAGSALAKLPELLKEAGSEPNFFSSSIFKTHSSVPFTRKMQPRYTRISEALYRVAHSTRSVYQAVLNLRAQAAIHAEDRKRLEEAAAAEAASDKPARVFTSSPPGVAQNGPIRPASSAGAWGKPAVAAVDSEAGWHKRLRLPSYAGLPDSVLDVAFSSSASSNAPTPTVDDGIAAAAGVDVHVEVADGARKDEAGNGTHAQSSVGSSSTSADDLAAAITNTKRGVLAFSVHLANFEAVASALERAYVLIAMVLCPTDKEVRRLMSGPSSHRTDSSSSSPSSQLPPDVLAEAVAHYGLEQRGTASSASSSVERIYQCAAAEALPQAVRDLEVLLSNFLSAWDHYLHSQAVAVFERGAASSASPSPVAGPPGIVSTSPVADPVPGGTTTTTTSSSSSSSAVPMSLSNIDALAYNSAAFALAELVGACGDLAAQARQLCVFMNRAQ